MARLLTLGFELQSPYEFTSESTVTAPSTRTYVTPGRAGITGSRYRRHAVATNNATGQVIIDLPVSRDELFIRAFWRTTGGTNSLRFALRNSSGTQVFALSGTGAQTVTIGTGTSGGTVDAAISGTSQNFTLFEMHIKIADSNGRIEIRHNGVMVYDFDGNTNPNSGNDISRIVWSMTITGTSTGTYDLDDIGVNDTSGSVENSWLGDGVVAVQLVNADGDVIQWKDMNGNDNANYLMVDEAIPDGDTTYVRAQTAGLTDLYQHTALPELPDSATIRLVQPMALARRDDPEDVSQLEIGVRSGATDDFADPQTLLMDYKMYYGDVYYTDPADDGVLDEENVNAMQLGIRSYVEE